LSLLAKQPWFFLALALAPALALLFEKQSKSRSKSKSRNAHGIKIERVLFARVLLSIGVTGPDLRRLVALPDIEGGVRGGAETNLLNPKRRNRLRQKSSFPHFISAIACTTPTPFSSGTACRSSGRTPATSAPRCPSAPSAARSAPTTSRRRRRSRRR